MDSALAWIGQIAEWVGKFFPRWVILDSTEGGVKFIGHPWRPGVKVVACGPGIVWFWPACTFFQSYPTARQTDNLPTQTFTTLDGKTIAVGGMLVYAVDDVVKLLTQTHSAAKAIQDIALTAVHDVCCSLAWESLCEMQRKGTLDTRLRNAANKQLEEYGVRVLKCMLTDLAVTRVLKVIQSVNQEVTL